MDTLDDIFTRGSQLDIQLLGELIRPYLVIDVDDNNRIIFNELGHEQTVETRVILFLLARKALSKRELIENEKTSPALLIGETGFKPGTVHPLLKSLKAKGLIVANDGLYSIPNHQLYKLKKRLIKEG